MIAVSAAAGLILVFKNREDLAAHIKNLQALAEFKDKEGDKGPAIYSEFVKPESNQDVVGWISHMTDVLKERIYSDENPEVSKKGPSSERAGEI